MSVQASIAGAQDHGHGHHWEFSAAPFLAVLGIFLFLPLGFSAYFVYNSTMLAAVAAGVGLPILLWGIAKWVSEGLTVKPLMEGLSPVAMPLFIVSEVFIFLSLFSAYWMFRLGADYWPPEGSVTMPTLLPIIMTVLLVSSSVTIHIGEEKLEHGDVAGFRSFLMLTLVLGFAFLGCTIYEYNHLIHVGFLPSTNAFGTAFFSITGFHASHVLVGLLAFVAILLPALGGKTNIHFVKSVSIYWHFVDAVWFFVVSQIYFW